MKSGTRALGLAESYARGSGNGSATSTLAGAVVRADRVVDGFVFSRCTVGGTDATDAAIECYRSLDREDVQYVLVAGVALAWYNLLDLHRLHEATDRPVIAVTFEDSDGLEPALREAFDGETLDRRLDRYRELPARHETTLNGYRVFYRAVGVDEEKAQRVLDAYAPEGGRPEPLRVARLAARGVEKIDDERSV